ncbi:hypothetical protein NC652_041613 [Populus alba x Populus x berolinensis]|nr:hypothetical protein NC652_041613 [Populus alba x Populus x berolinensis]
MEKLRTYLQLQRPKSVHILSFAEHPLLKVQRFARNSACFGSQLPSKSTMSTFSPSSEQTVGLQSQLAEVAAQEKLLIGEYLELLQIVSILQVES